MKQIIQDLKKGDTILEEVPAPMVRPGHVLIKTHRSLVSLGTERMLVEFGRGNLISKARQQPEKVKQVLDKIKSDGLMPTLEAVFKKLDEPLPLGYCNAGEVVAVGNGVSEFKIGDRVASNGHHAEIVCVPKNLCARIPDNVSYDEAAFTVIGAIGLQGIRLAEPTFGETVVVIGLGLIGLITAELLVANGCRVIGFDFDDKKVGLARSKGITALNSSVSNPVNTVHEMTDGVGADAVLITASTKSNDVISEAAQMSRKRGRIILIGVIGLDIQRSDFYKKELSFQVSCSYGPGRYDEDYEQRGIDYPLPYVRWTEKRNFETVLHCLSSGRLNVKDLITQQVHIHDYLKIYGNLGNDAIASILEYPAEQFAGNGTLVRLRSTALARAKGVVGVIGAGNFTKMTVLPALKGKAPLKIIASAGGLSAQALAKKYGFSSSTTDYQEVLRDPEVDIVVITTRHDLHASMVIESLRAGKHVFVEKPLALNELQLSDIIQTYSHASSLSLNIGFNRRFSPFMQKAKRLLGHSDVPISVVITVNAGYIEPGIWIHDMNVGGGRIIGEGCHFFDLASFLTGGSITEITMKSLGSEPRENTDNAVITLKYDNGSVAVINYFSNGNKTYSKERIEVYSQGRTLVCDNFRKLSGYGFKNFSSMSRTQDKGHQHQFALLLERIREGGESLISFESLVNTTRATFAAIESLKSGSTIRIK